MPCRDCQHWRRLDPPDHLWGSCTLVSRPDHPNEAAPFCVISDELLGTAQLLTFGDIFSCQQFVRRRRIVESGKSA